MSEKDFHFLFNQHCAAASDQGGVQLTNGRIGAPAVTTFTMANNTVINESANTVANQAVENAAENAAEANVQVTMNKVKANVQSVFINQFEDQAYKTLSLMLNKPLKVMKQNDAGIYEETTTQFLSLPVSAALSQIEDDVLNYFVAVKGADAETLKTALGGATIEVEQKLFAAGQAEGDVANETDHDQWFSFIKKVSPSKMAMLVMASQLGVSLGDLKAIME